MFSAFIHSETTTYRQKHVGQSLSGVLRLLSLTMLQPRACWVDIITLHILNIFVLSFKRSHPIYILSQIHICFIFQDTVCHITYTHIIYIQTAICVTIKEPFDHTQIFKLMETSFLERKWLKENRRESTELHENPSQPCLTTFGDTLFVHF